MPITFLPRPNETNFKPVPAGTWAAICFRIVELGTQDAGAFQGKPKHKVLLSFEIHDEECRTDDGQPMVINSPRYTYSMHEKSRRELEAWRGQAFTDKDFGEGGFTLSKLLGVPCLLSVVHTVGNNGKTYANVA